MDLQNQISLISTQNYWWKEGGVKLDPDLTIHQKSHLSYNPMPVHPKECLEEGVISLRGPRRVGKTLSLKLLVLELIQNHHWNPKEILWVQAETIRSMSDLESILNACIQNFHPKLLLIDEVSSIKGWQKVIKKMRDIGLLSQACTIITGSSAHDIKTGVERMAGRRGSIQNPDRVLLPMGLKEFQYQLETNFQGSIEKNQIQQYFLQFGGFPFRVERLIQTLKKSKNPIADEDLQVFDDVLFYEINRRRLDRNTAISILGRLASIGANACSYQGFSKPLGISKETVKKYLDALGDAFLLVTFASYDTSRQRVSIKKDKKFLWIDPALGRLAYWQQQGALLPEADLAECVVGLELLKQFEKRLWEGVSAPRNVFTWKSASSHEIDFLIIDKSKKIQLPIEVKWQESISDWDFQVMERAFGNGILVTKSVEYQRAKSKALPLFQFLLSQLEVAPMN